MKIVTAPVLFHSLEQSHKSTLRSYLFTMLILLSVTVTTMTIGGFLISRSIWTTYTDSVIESSHELAQRFNQSLNQSIEMNGEVDWTLEHFQDMMQELPYGEEGFVCLIDNDDKVVSHPNSQMIGSQMDRSSFVEFNPTNGLIQQLSKGLSYLAEMPAMEGEHMVYQLKEADLPWTVSVHTDLEAHRKRVTSIQKVIVFLSIPMLLIIPVVGGLLSRNVSRKYEKALQQTNVELEKLVDERTKELQITKRAAEDSDRLKSEFLSIMSHEYRTPLNGILGIGTLLKDEAETDEDHEIIDDLLTSGKRLNDLMERILNFAETGSGQHKVRLKELSMDTLESIIETNLKEVVMNQGVNFEFKRCHSESPDQSIFTDNKLLTIAMRELFDNAVKFGNDSKVEVELKTFNSPDKQLQLSVKDQGVGISQKQQLQLFKPINQLDQRTNRKFEGIGIGLVMVKRIADLLKGSISLRSESQNGTIFVLTIPTNHFS